LNLTPKRVYVNYSSKSVLYTCIQRLAAVFMVQHVVGNIEPERNSKFVCFYY